MGRKHESLCKTSIKRPSGAKQRTNQRNRHGTEWDIRVTMTKVYTTDMLVNALKDAQAHILYYLVSGAELGKAREEENQLDLIKGTRIPDYVHHHVCLVLHQDTSYGAVMDMLRISHRTPRYAVIRDNHYTYTGWVLHAIKPMTKVDPNVTKVVEWGTRPMDGNDLLTRQKIGYIAKMYGSDETKKDFEDYILEYMDGKNARQRAKRHIASVEKNIAKKQRIWEKKMFEAEEAGRQLEYAKQLQQLQHATPGV